MESHQGRERLQSADRDCRERAENRHSDWCKKCPGLFGARRCLVEKVDPAFTKSHGLSSFVVFRVVGFFPTVRV